MQAGRGPFIVFEGGEGSGKSTQSSLLVDYLISKGLDVCATRESRSTHPAAYGAKNGLDARTELFLFMADRCQHQYDVIAPAMHRKEVVVCDSYADSTFLSYQMYARNVEIKGVETRNLFDFAMQGIKPDIIFWLDIPPEEGLKRERGASNAMDSQPLEFHKIVHNHYSRLHEYQAWRPGRGRIERVDATLPKEEIAAEVSRIADEFLRSWVGNG